jgi:hypothetical protein
MSEALTTGVGDEQARMRSFIIGVCGLPARVCSLLEFHEFDCASLRMACEEDLKDCGLAKGPRKKIVVLAAQHITEEVVESPFCPGSFSAPSPSSLLTAPQSEQISVPPSPSKNLPLSIPDDLCLRGHHLSGGPSLPKPSDTAVPTPDQDLLIEQLRIGRHKARQQRLQEHADAFQALIESEKKEQESAQAAAQAAMLEEQQKQEAEAAALARANWRQARRDATRTAAAAQDAAAKAARKREMQEQMKLAAEAQKAEARAKRSHRQQMAELAEQEEEAAAAAAAAPRRKQQQLAAAAAAGGSDQGAGSEAETPPSSPEQGGSSKRAQARAEAKLVQQERLKLRFLVRGTERQRDRRQLRAQPGMITGPRGVVTDERVVGLAPRKSSRRSPSVQLCTSRRRQTWRSTWRR